MEGTSRLPEIFANPIFDKGLWGRKESDTTERLRPNYSKNISIILITVFPPRSLKKGQTLFPAVSGVPAPVGERQEAGLASCLSPGG